MTLLVSDIIRSGYKNTDYFNTNFMDLIRNQRSRIFGFDYPIDNKLKKILKLILSCISLITVFQIQQKRTRIYRGRQC